MSVRFHDMFCGAGGSTLGATQAGAQPVVGLNHWAIACESYEANHAPSGAVAACVDVVTQDPRRYPAAEMLLASPECTHHSYARGRPKDDPSLFDPHGDQAAERSRATMWDVVRFAEVHAYRLVIVENVEAAVKWGLPRGHKLKHGAYGPLFAAWLNAMGALGYEHELVHLNSLVCGVPQSRDRLYVVFWKRGQRRPDLAIPALGLCPSCERLVWAEQRFKRAGATTGTLGRQYAYVCPDCGAACALAVRPAASVIDFDNVGTVIGERLVPLRPATIERIRRGLLRLRERQPVVQLSSGMVVQGVVVPTTHADGSQRGRLVVEPLPSQTGRQEQALVISNMANNVPRCAGYEPTATVTSGGKLGLVLPAGGNPAEARALQEAMHTLVGSDRLAVVVTCRGADRGADRRATDPEADPLATITASGNHHALIVEERGNPFRPGGGNDARRALEETIGTVSAGGNHHALVIANPGSPGAGAGKQGWARHVDAGTLGAVTAADSHALFTYRDGQDVRGVGEPVPTITSVEQHALVGEITQDEIDACTFRMLQPDELKLASGFTEAYRLHGTKRDQVCQIGNAVTAPAEAELVRRALASLDETGVA